MQTYVLSAAEWHTRRVAQRLCRRAVDTCPIFLWCGTIDQAVAELHDAEAGFRRYCGNDAHSFAHEAGYDAFMTGCVTPTSPQHT